MNIKRKQSNTTLTVTVNGRIDTATAPEFENGVKPYLTGITELILDAASRHSIGIVSIVLPQR